MEKIRDWDKKTSFSTTTMGAKLLPCFYYYRHRNIVERCRCREKLPTANRMGCKYLGYAFKRVNA